MNTTRFPIFRESAHTIIFLKLFCFFNVSDMVSDILNHQNLAILNFLTIKNRFYNRFLIKFN